MCATSSLRGEVGSNSQWQLDQSALGPVPRLRPDSVSLLGLSLSSLSPHNSPWILERERLWGWHALLPPSLPLLITGAGGGGVMAVLV